MMGMMMRRRRMMTTTTMMMTTMRMRMKMRWREEEEDDDDDDIDVSCPHRVLARLRDQPSSIDDQDLMRRAAHGLSPLGH